MSCDGETPTDTENIGDIKYFPEPGFRSNDILASKKDDTKPLVAVFFENPQSKICFHSLNY